MISFAGLLRLFACFRAAYSGIFARIRSPFWSRKNAGSEPVLDLTESNSTSAGLTYPADGNPGCARRPPCRCCYQPTPRGLDAAREAVSRYYAERGANVLPERILLTASTSEAYAYLFKLLADPGDEILTPRPSYPLFEFLANLESVKVRQYPLRYDGAWHVDFDALARSITPRTRRDGGREPE